MKNKVKQANELIRTTHRMTNGEVKAMIFCLATRNKGETKVTIPLSEFKRKIGVDKGGEQNKYLKRYILALMDKSRLYIPASQSRTGEEIAGYIIPTTRWSEKNNTLKISFNEDFLPLLDDLKDNYTWLQLEQIALLKGKYSVRVYEFLKMILPENKNETTFMWYLDHSSEKAPSFRKYLDLENHYKRFNNLRVKVIEPSFQEINEKSDVYINYKTYSRGREVIRLDLTIVRKQFIDEDILGGQTTIEEYIDDNELGDILKNFD